MECLRGGAAVHGFACCVAVHVVVLSSGGGMYETSSYVVGFFQGLRLYYINELGVRVYALCIYAILS